MSNMHASLQHASDENSEGQRVSVWLQWDTAAPPMKDCQWAACQHPSGCASQGEAGNEHTSWRVKRKIHTVYETWLLLRPPMVKSVGPRQPTATRGATGGWGPPPSVPCSHSAGCPRMCEAPLVPPGTAAAFSSRAGYGIWMLVSATPHGNRTRKGGDCDCRTG